MATKNLFWQRMLAVYHAVSRKITLKKATLVAGVVLLLSLVPVGLVARYTWPQIDDYTFGALPHLAWQETGSILQVLYAAARYTAGLYTSWQGSFTGCFVMALQPGIFGSRYYALTPFIIMLGLYLGLFMLCRAVFTKALKLPPVYAWYTFFVTALVMVQLLPSAAQGLYWYNGGIFYVFFFGLSLLLYAFSINSVMAQTKAGRAAWMVAACVMGVVVGGGNYICAPASVMALALGTMVLMLRKNKKAWLLAAPLVCTTAALLGSLAAPGNTIRQAIQGENGLPFIKSIVYAFYNGVTAVNAWLSIPFLLGMLLLVPVFWRAAAKLQFAYRLPGLVALGSFCFLSALFFPHLYSMGTTGPPRLYNVLFLSFAVLFLANLFYLLGWMQRKLAALQADGAAASRRVTQYCKRNTAGLLLVCVLGSGLFALSNREFYSGVFAAHTLSIGTAADYNTQRAVWEELLLGAEDEVALPPIEARPMIFLVEDNVVSVNPEYLTNQSIARYYQKKAVWIDAELGAEEYL